MACHPCLHSPNSISTLLALSVKIFLWLVSSSQRLLRSCLIPALLSRLKIGWDWEMRFPYIHVFRLIFVDWFLLLSNTKVSKMRFTTRHVSSVSLSEPSKSWSMASRSALRASHTSYHILRHDCICIATNAKRIGSMIWCCLSCHVNLHVIKSTHLHFLFLPKRKT